MDIRVLRFFTKINKVGKVVEWVEYAPAHDISNTVNVARIKDLTPDPNDESGDKPGTSAFHQRAVWSFIEPRYRAWKAGVEMPEVGVPLASWPLLNEAEVQEFNRAGYRSVEEVAGMSEGALDKIRLPNARGIRKQAGLFLETLKASQETANTVAMQNELEATKAAMAELLEQVAELRAAQDDKPKRGRPAKAQADSEEAAA